MHHRRRRASRQMFLGVNITGLRTDKLSLFPKKVEEMEAQMFL